MSAPKAKCSSILHKIRPISILHKIKSIYEKISNAIPRPVKAVLLFLIDHGVIAIATAAIAAIIATNHINKIAEQDFINQRKYEIINAVNGIYIGSNKDWIDAKLGPATFSGLDKDESILQSIYIFDSILVRVFFDTDSYTCKAFFVTLLSYDDSIKIELPEVYSRFVNKKPLGKFSYYEVAGAPLSAYGFISQGPARAFYAEAYYFMSGGNYNTFIFATMDYGIKKSVQGFIDQLQNFEDQADDELNSGYTRFVWEYCIDRRDETCPNTYGISSLEDDDLTIMLLSDYDIFDSLQFRDMNVEIRDE